MTVEKVKVGAVSSVLFGLVRRGLISEGEHKFAVTPEGERALAQAKATAKRWIKALGD